MNLEILKVVLLIQELNLNKIKSRIGKMGHKPTDDLLLNLKKEENSIKHLKKHIELVKLNIPLVIE